MVIAKDLETLAQLQAQQDDKARSLVKVPAYTLRNSGS